MIECSKLVIQSSGLEENARFEMVRSSGFFFRFRPIFFSDHFLFIYVRGSSLDENIRFEMVRSSGIFFRFRPIFEPFPVRCSGFLAGSIFVKKLKFGKFEVRFFQKLGQFDSTVNTMHVFLLKYKAVIDGFF